MKVKDHSPVINQASRLHAAHRQSPARPSAAPRQSRQSMRQHAVINEGLVFSGRAAVAAQINAVFESIRFIRLNIYRGSESTIDAPSGPMLFGTCSALSLAFQIFIEMATQGHIMSEKGLKAHNFHDGGQPAPDLKTQSPPDKSRNAPSSNVHEHRLFSFRPCRYAKAQLPLAHRQIKPSWLLNL
jgi:hypothetical protein